MNMNGNIEVAFTGRIGTEPELRTSQNGKPWLRFSVAVGQDDSVQWVQVACFGDRARELVDSLQKGDRCYVEGTIQLNEWTNQSDEKRSGLSVAAWRCDKLGNIGRNKPAKPKSEGRDGQRSNSEPNDPLPF
jgi:single-strand DNA-binding protein